MKELEEKSSFEYLVSFDDLPQRELLKPCVVKCGNCGGSGFTFCLVYWAPADS